MTELGEIAELKYEPLISDKITKKLKPKIQQLAEKLTEASMNRRYIMLRFHGDADGISGALALSEVLKCYAYQQNAAVYSVRDAIRDLSNLTNEDNPLAVFLDFGMNKESEEGLGLLKAAGVELVLIDHHPPSEKIYRIADFVLTPWEFSNGEDVSRYVAGYLAAEVARAMGAVEAEKYAAIACAGDKSTVFETGEVDYKAALVMDYLATHAAYGNNLRFYKSIIGKKELFDSIYMQAEEKIEEAATKSMRSMKELQTANGILLYTVDVYDVVKKGEFPNRSKVTTRIFDKVKGNGAVVVLGTGEKTIIIRINDAAAAKGISAESIAEKIAVSMDDFVESGGGHIKAGALRIKEGFAN